MLGRGLEVSGANREQECRRQGLLRQPGIKQGLPECSAQHSEARGM